MMSILICDPNFSPVGAPTRSPLLIKIKGWQKKRVNISIVCSSEAKEFYQKHLQNIDFFCFPFSWKSKVRVTAPLEYIRANFLVLPLLFKVKGKFDIVYSLSSTLDII